jgi:YOP protein translocation protein YscK
LVEFNLHPARFAHRSWFGEEPGVQSSAGTAGGISARHDARAERGLSGWLLRELDLHEEMDWEMSGPQKRLWLFDGPSLERLSLELALAMHREWLLQVIDAAQLRMIGSKVGEHALRFAIEDVPSGSFRYHSPTVSFAVDAEDDLRSTLQEAGARTLMALLRPAWRAVRGRAQLYFDRCKELADVPPLEAAHREQALEFIGTRLVPRRFPEWAWCF